jgi:hypothetical protein
MDDDDYEAIDYTGLSDRITITMDESESTGRRAEPVTGGAGYTHQLETGSTGSVNFDLDAKEQYRTVTLAI